MGRHDRPGELPVFRVSTALRARAEGGQKHGLQSAVSQQWTVVGPLRVFGGTDERSMKEALTQRGEWVGRRAVATWGDTGVYDVRGAVRPDTDKAGNVGSGRGCCRLEGRTPGGKAVKETGWRRRGGETQR